MYVYLYTCTVYIYIYIYIYMYVYIHVHVHMYVICLSQSGVDMYIEDWFVMICCFSAHAERVADSSCLFIILCFVNITCLLKDSSHGTCNLKHM